MQFLHDSKSLRFYNDDTRAQLITNLTISELTLKDLDALEDGGWFRVVLNDSRPPDVLRYVW